MTERNTATAITTTTLGAVSDRNEFGEPTFYEARHVNDVLFSEEYTPDKIGRITSKTVRIVDPATGDIETYEAKYTYKDPTGQLETVQYNDQPVITYVYDGNNNLLGEAPATPTAIPTPEPEPVRLYARSSAPGATPVAFKGSWGQQSVAGSQLSVVEMAREKQGTATATTIDVPDCTLTAENRQLTTVLVSPQLATARAMVAGDRFDFVIGADQGAADDDLRMIASAWIMNGSGGLRCRIAIDEPISDLELPTSAKGVSGFLELTTDNGPLTTSCTGTTAQVGDRLVIELGFECTATATSPVQGTLYHGGVGPDVLPGVAADGATCGRPGYVELADDWDFSTSSVHTLCEPNVDDVPFVVASRRLTSVTIAPGSNRVSAAVLTEPDGTPRHYNYTFDASGALDTRTDTITGEVSDFDYDEFGNLRHVELPDDRSIDYLIDAANRRVGRVLKDAGGNIIEEKRWLYQSALRPVAEVDATGAVQTFFVYVDKPNVPEYMVKSGIKYRIVTDHLGSVRLVVNTASGAVAQRMDYDEWGNVTQDTNPGFQPFGFAGGLYEGESGLVRFGARDFDPRVGRWTDRDPIGLGSAASNLYSYSDSDPVNGADPTGLVKIKGAYSEPIYVHEYDADPLFPSKPHGHIGHPDSTRKVNPYTGEIYEGTRNTGKKLSRKGLRVFQQALKRAGLIGIVVSIVSIANSDDAFAELLETLDPLGPISGNTQFEGDELQALEEYYEEADYQGRHLQCRPAQARCAP